MHGASSPLKAPSPQGAGADVGSVQSLGKVLGLLGGKSDEEKFAGLLLVTKTVKSDDAEAMGRIFSAVGLTFMLRLLATPGSPGDSSDTSGLYMCMALNVLSGFCSLPDLTQKLQEEASFTSAAPRLLSCLDNTDMEGAWKDAVSCMLCLASYPPGRDALIAQNAPRALSSWLSRGPNDREQETKMGILEILERLLVPEVYPGAVARAMPSLSAALREDKSVAKLSMVSALDRALSFHGAAFSAELEREGDKWEVDIRETVLELLQNKAHGPLRHQLLSICLGMCMLRGAGWAVPRVREVGTDTDGRMPQMLVGMSKIELRLTLETPPGEGLPAEAAVVVPMCLGIVEKALDFAGDEAEDAPWAALSTKAILYMKADFEEVANTVCERLQDWREEWKSTPGPITEPMFMPLVASDTYTRQLELAMPLLCRGVSESAGGGVGSPMYPLFGEGAGALWLLLPCLSSLSSEESVCEALANAKGVDRIVDMLQFALGEDGCKVGCLGEVSGVSEAGMCRGDGLVVNAVEVIFNTFSQAPSSIPYPRILPLSLSLNSLLARLTSSAPGWNYASAGTAVVAAVLFQILRFAPPGSVGAKHATAAKDAAIALSKRIMAGTKGGVCDLGGGDGEDGDDAEVGLVEVCVSSLMEAVKRHRLIAEAVQGVDWPTKATDKCLGFEFEVEQVTGMMAALRSGWEVLGRGSEEERGREGGGDAGQGLSAGAGSGGRGGEGEGEGGPVSDSLEELD